MFCPDRQTRLQGTRSIAHQPRLWPPEWQPVQDSSLCQMRGLARAVTRLTGWSAAKEHMPSSNEVTGSISSCRKSLVVPRTGTLSGESGVAQCPVPCTAEAHLRCTCSPCPAFLLQGCTQQPHARKVLPRLAGCTALPLLSKTNPAGSQRPVRISWHMLSPDRGAVQGGLPREQLLWQERESMGCLGSLALTTLLVHDRQPQCCHLTGWLSSTGWPEKASGSVQS